MFDKLPISYKTEKILTKSLDEQISVEEANYLMNIKGADLYPLLATADYLRQEFVGDKVTFINNCNINFTNICTVRCGFCVFGKDEGDSEAYILNDEQILAKAQGAVEKGAHEFCVMGGVLPDADIEYYEHLMHLLKDEYPDVMIHGFSPTMIADACKVSGIDIAEGCERLRDAGLDTLPGTAAEILTDRSRELICPEKVSVSEWIDIVKTAHEAGVPGSATIMYGHVETLEERVEHIDIIRKIQEETHGFTEFIPMTFIPNAWSLAFWRFLLGIISAGLLPAAQTIITLNVPPEAFGRVFSYNQSFQAVGAVLGSLLGSTISGMFTYEWVFAATGITLLINYLIMQFSSQSRNA